MRDLKSTLYRDSDDCKIAGVCSGIAHHWGWETWLVRIIALSGLFLSGTLFFFAYIAAWIILDKKPAESKWRQNIKRESSAPLEIKSKVWQAGSPPRQAFFEVKGAFDELDRRLQRLETHVTSRRFNVAREIDRL
ncbi:envelope stress response membrane protein PspC [Catenovulum sp. SM1970]|uniref:envelope stress response membrane protein PspC n=1 Tax=Marinifaba aquimaris TaxID=2741323 RepID=UPI001572DCAC|nr:envelope stress response membrane protein PspC [Marinifaba aquimaris]NTS77818.1 envelope stress response membrane protein PspC [Marinifaba aquimaris]